MLELLESIEAIAIIAGIATRLFAALYIILGIGIIFTSHIQFGFFKNWFRNQQGEGYEFFLLWVGMAISLVIIGSGRYSLDKRLILLNASASNYF